MTRVWYVTHPDVVMDPELPVPRWPLSERGLERMRAGLALPFVGGITHVFSSDEQKALDGAAVWVEASGAAHHVDPALGENDRSATGFLPPDEFESVVRRFFGEPEQSVLGWERAVDAQARVVAAVDRALAGVGPDARVAFVAHGGVGALLLAHVMHAPISQRLDQPREGARPGSGGGHYFEFEWSPPKLLHGWRAIDAPVSGG
ncbi:MAG: histidine phosphatase family protein [Myxococcota bacterium]|nr:histidine phosphatase family protein [Myxococcota bacterium]